jgi:hypothetical protein
MFLWKENRRMKLHFIVCILIVLGYAAAQLVEALRCNSGGHGFNSRWCHWNFSLTQSFQPHCGRGVDSGSNGNEHQEHFLGVKATGA